MEGEMTAQFGYMEDFLTTKELSVWLQVSERTIENWRREKVGPPYRKLGHAVRYLRAEILSWLEQGKLSPSA